MALTNTEPPSGTIERAVWMVTSLGLTTVEAHKATNEPCSMAHLYRCVAIARAKMVESTKEGTKDILHEVIASDTATEVSRLTPPITERTMKSRSVKRPS
mmetsp:Transcript_12719/g.26927  ORF Transcript_12719/g.26927 Transcript_12719/m.26927 type:complete len:100 (+) Transcript_12719:47-346(+)